MIDGNKAINWYPDYIKDGRFGDWLKNNVDWAFSRERYWGTPLPIWRCEKCGSMESVGSVAELKAKPGFNGLKEPLDLHRPYLDEVTFFCAKCGSYMHRTPRSWTAGLTPARCLLPSYIIPSRIKNYLTRR